MITLTKFLLMVNEQSLTYDLKYIKNSMELMCSPMDDSAKEKVYFYTMALYRIHDDYTRHGIEPFNIFENIINDEQKLINILETTDIDTIIELYKIRILRQMRINRYNYILNALNRDLGIVYVHEMYLSEPDLVKLPNGGIFIETSSVDTDYSIYSGVACIQATIVPNEFKNDHVKLAVI